MPNNKFLSREKKIVSCINLILYKHWQQKFLPGLQNVCELLEVIIVKDSKLKSTK